MNSLRQTAAALGSSRLATVIRTFKHELWAIALFSAVINVLMLSPTLYMLQVFDRVMISRSELTLLVLTLIVLFFYGVQALASGTARG